MVEVRQLHHRYKDNTEIRWEGIPFLVRAGERVALVGASGSGKTTLVRHILGFLQPAAGTVRVLGCEPYRDFSHLRWQVAAVLQEADEQIIGPTVYDDLAFSLRARGCSASEVEARVQKMATDLGISELLTKLPHYLSGGEKQKVALAGAMITQPRLLILDEPFSGLDLKARRHIVELVQRLHSDQGTTVITATHDLDLVPDIADQVYVLHQGHLVAAGSPQDILTSLALLRSVDLEPAAVVQLGCQLVARGVWQHVPVNLAAAWQQTD